MSKVLKLTGLKSWTGSVSNSNVVRKGEIARFDDDVAAKVMAGKRLNSDGEPVPYWVEVEGETTPKYDFSTPVDSAEEAPVIPAQVSQRVRRASGASVAK